MQDASLDAFGKLLVKRVRDEAIEQWSDIIDGRMKGTTAEKVRRDLLGSSEAERALLKKFVPGIVDTLLHHLMWTVEQEEAVSLRMNGGPELRQVSDGLPGDLIGWREKYGKYPGY